MIVNGRDWQEKGRFRTSAVSSGKGRGGDAVDGDWRGGKGAALSQGMRGLLMLTSGVPCHSRLGLCRFYFLSMTFLVAFSTSISHFSLAVSVGRWLRHITVTIPELE